MVVFTIWNTQIAIKKKLYNMIFLLILPIYIIENDDFWRSNIIDICSIAQTYLTNTECENFLLI